MRKHVLYLMSQLLLLIALSLQSRAQDPFDPSVDDGGSQASTAYTWTGATSTAWSTATNWTPNGVPGSVDHMTVGSATRAPLLDANHSVLAFTINTGTLHLGGFTLKVNGDTYLSQGTLVNGSLVVTAAHYWTLGF
jgi:hypothetical protein